MKYTEVINMINTRYNLDKAYEDPENFVRGGPTLTGFLFVCFFDEGWDYPNTTISGPLSAR